MKILLFLFAFTLAQIDAVPSSHKIEPTSSASASTEPTVPSSHKIQPTSSASASTEPTVPSSHKIQPTSSASASAKPTVPSSHKIQPTSSASASAPPPHSTVVASNTSSKVVPTTSVIVSNSSSKVVPTTSVIVSNSSSKVVPTTSAITPSKSTSHAPMSTSMVPTLPPVTTPSPDVTFNYVEGNKTCLQFEGDINIVVFYSDEANKSVSQSFHLDHTTKVSGGKCSNLTKANSTSHIKMTVSNLLDVTVQFIGGDKWYMSEIDVVVYNKAKKNLNTTLTKLSASHKYGLKSNDGLYQASSGHSYACPTLKKLPLENTNATIKSYNITVDFKDIKVQPFDKPGHFVNSYTCPASTGGDTGSSIVPIAVGCALAGLIVIVLIAYLIGRRKGNNRGYQQV